MQLRALAAVVMVGSLALAAMAQDEFSVTVNQTTKRVQIKSGDQSALLLVSRGSVRLGVGAGGYSIRFSAGDQTGYAADFLTATFESAEITKNTETEKEVKAVYKLAYATTKPHPKSRRGVALAKGQEAPKVDARIEMVLSAVKGRPYIRLRHRVVNTGEPFVCYCLPWLGGGPGYVVPGPMGPQVAKWKKKYSTVSKGKIPWVFVSRAKGRGLGVVFPDPAKIFVGEYGNKKAKVGAIYLNTIPRKVKLAKGGSVEIDLIFMRAATAEEVAKVSAQVPRK